MGKMRHEKGEADLTLSITLSGDRERAWLSTRLGASPNSDGIGLFPTPSLQPPATADTEVAAFWKHCLKGLTMFYGDTNAQGNPRLTCHPVDYTLCGLSKRDNEAETADILTFCPFTPLQSHFPQPEQP